MYENIKEVDKAWTAGIIDGEGCLTIQASKMYYKQTQSFSKYKTNTYISVRMTDCNAIKKLSDLWGGCVSLTPPKNSGVKMVYGWCPSNKKHKKFLESILPYLVTKRDNAKLLIQLRERMEKKKGIIMVQRKGHKSPWITDEENKIRMQLRDTVSSLNRNGRFPYQSHTNQTNDWWGSK